MEINYSLLGIEIITAILAMGTLIFGVLIPKENKYSIGYIVSIGFIALFFYSFKFYGVNSELLGGLYIIDDFSVFFKQVIFLAAALIALSSTTYIKKIGNNYGEFFAIFTFATLGMLILVSAGDFITLYLAIETMSIAFYILAGYKKRDEKSAEAGIKYLLLGAMSSAIMLYGLSLVYGITGTTIIGDLASRVSKMDSLSPAMTLGIIFIVAGFGFKISAVPFQMWSPDVYEGAPTPVTSYLASGSKAAVFSAMVRLFFHAFPSYVSQWVTLFTALAFFTIVLGNFVAIPQTNIKRLLAYSSIAQAGYLLIGMVAANRDGVKAIAFYSMIYVIATIGAFAVLSTFYSNVGSNDTKDYAGLATRSPLLAATLTICFLSMAGIPPLSGFTGKFYLFYAALKQGYLGLVIVGLIMSTVSVYYYLSVVKIMYMGDPVDDRPIQVDFGSKVTILLAMVATIFLGIYPEPISILTNMVAKSLKVF